MSKAVLISIRPKWCEKIASGEKTIEVRKTRPKLQTPFKCYIYCTQGDDKRRLCGSWGKVIALIANAPSVDVVPVVHGRWIERRAPHAMGGNSAKCSACNKSVQYLGNPLNYCPNCGAKMDGGDSDAAD